jgi:hypothetical protein
VLLHAKQMDLGTWHFNIMANASAEIHMANMAKMPIRVAHLNAMEKQG